APTTGSVSDCRSSRRSPRRTAAGSCWTTGSRAPAPCSGSACRSGRIGDMNRILVVEDEERIAAFVAKGLRAEGFTPTVVGDGITGFDYAMSGEFDLVILDIGLPGDRKSVVQGKGAG